MSEIGRAEYPLTFTPEFICNPKSIFTWVWWAFADMPSAVKKLSCPKHTFPASVNIKKSLRVLLSAHPANKSICMLFAGVFLLKLAPKRSAEVMLGVPRCKKVGICLMEKIRVFE